MWYLKKVANSCKELGSVCISLRPEYIKSSLHNLGNGREDENGRRYRSLLVFMIKRM